MPIQRATIQQPLRPGKRHRDLNISSRETNLIQTAYRAAFVIQVVSFLLRQCDSQGPVLSGDSGEVVPFEVPRLPEAEVDGFTEWIVAGVGSSFAIVESVREDGF